MQGDSGSPLITTTPTGDHVLQGIVSCKTGRKDGKTPTYHYYTKVAEYEDWIKGIDAQIPTVLKEAKNGDFL